MSKKGVSPLIGTVLLVAIVIAMILLIMPWITKTIKSQQEKATESLTAMSCATELDFTLSLDGNNIKIDNRGTVGIIGIKYRVYDINDVVTDSGSQDYTGDEIIDAFEVKDSLADCTGGVKAEIIAVIEGKTVCGDNSREIDCPVA